METQKLSADDSIKAIKLARAIDHFRDVDAAFPVSYIAALLAVAREPGLTGSDYAGRLDIAQPVLSRILLEIGPKSRHGRPGLKWITSVSDPDDLPRKRIYLTPLGQEVVRDALDALR